MLHSIDPVPLCLRPHTFRSCILFVMLSGCLAAACGEDAPGTEGAQTGEACAQSTLVEQCPPGSNPILGATADTLCGGSASGSVESASGAVTGQCYGEGTCNVACQFSSPCRCGVDRITNDGVFCVECTDAAPCGDGLCSDGENPQTCEIDCGERCESGQFRCNGANIQGCNINGYWDTLACPTGEVCVEIGVNEVDCERGDIIDIPDMGVADTTGRDVSGGDGGRLNVGNGLYPGTSDGPGVAAAAPSRMLHSFIPGGELQGTTLVDVFTVDPDTLIMCSSEAGALASAATGCVATSGWTEVVDEDTFCAAYDTCFSYTEDASPCRADNVFLTAGTYSGVIRSGAPVATCELQRLTTETCPITGLLSDGCPAAEGTHWLDLDTTDGPRDFVASPSGRYVAYVRNDGSLNFTIWMMDLETETETEAIDLGAYYYYARRIAINDAGVVAVLGADVNSCAVAHLAAVWRAGDDEVTANIVPQPEGECTGAVGVALSPNGQVLAIAWRGPIEGSCPTCAPGWITLWNLDSGREIVTISDATTPMAFSPRNHEFVSSSLDGREIEIWDLENNEVSSTLDVGELAVDALGFNPSGELLAVWVDGAFEPYKASLSLWDVDSSTRAYFYESDVGHLAVSTWTLRVQWSPDGSYLLTRAEDDTRYLFGPSE